MFSAGNAGRHQPGIFFFSADAAGSRITAGNDFAEDGEVRCDVEIALGAADGGAEAGDHFVENQQGAVLVAEIANAFVVFLGNRTGAAFRTTRLDDDRCGAAAELVQLQHALQHVQVIRTNLVGEGVEASRNSVGFQQSAGARNLRAVDHLIAPAVVIAAFFNDALVSGSDAGDSQGGHDGFRAASQHSEHLHPRHVLVNLFGQKKFGFVQESGDRAAFVEQLDDRVPNGRIVAAQNGWAAGLKEVQVLIAVLVVEVGPFGFPEGYRERFVEGQIVLHASRDVFLRFFVDGF